MPQPEPVTTSTASVLVQRMTQISKGYKRRALPTFGGAGTQLLPPDEMVRVGLTWPPRAIP